MKYINVGKFKVACFSPTETKRFPNKLLGHRFGRIFTTETLQEDKKLSQYINENTMGALDNYANHEKLHIYITPLENDLFDNVSVGIYGAMDMESKNHGLRANFAMKTEEGKDGFHKFFKELYTNVVNAVNGAKAQDK